MSLDDKIVSLKSVAHFGSWIFNIYWKFAVGNFRTSAHLEYRIDPWIHPGIPESNGRCLHNSIHTC